MEKKKKLLSKLLIFGDLISEAENESDSDENPHLETPRILEEGEFRFTSSKWDYKAPDNPSSPHQPEIEQNFTFQGPPDYKSSTALDNPSSPHHPDMESGVSFQSPAFFRQKINVDDPPSPHHAEFNNLNFDGPPTYKQNLNLDEDLPVFIDDSSQEPRSHSVDFNFRRKNNPVNLQCNRMMAMPSIPSEKNLRPLRKPPKGEDGPKGNSPYQEKLWKMVDKTKKRMKTRNKSSGDLLRSNGKLNEIKTAYSSSRPGSNLPRNKSYSALLPSSVRSLARSESKPGLIAIRSGSREKNGDMKRMKISESRAGLKLDPIRA